MEGWAVRQSRSAVRKLRARSASAPGAALEPPVDLPSRSGRVVTVGQVK
jgi:hypothetical protein